MAKGPEKISTGACRAVKEIYVVYLTKCDFIHFIYYMQEGPSKTQNTAVSGSETKDNMFMLMRIAQHPARVAVEVDFSAAQTSSCAGSSLLPRTLPVFNKDSKYYTPSFILNTDKVPSS